MEPKSKSWCPYVEKPFEECYVTGLSSSAMEKAIIFCGGHFETCKIYLKRISMEKAVPKPCQDP